MSSVHSLLNTAAPVKVEERNLLTPVTSNEDNSTSQPSGTNSPSSETSNPPLFICQWGETCSKQFADAEQMYQHLCNDHVGRKSQKNLQLKCAFGDCTVETTKRDHITSHLRVHVPSKPFSCSNCKKKFKRSQDLKKHLKVHFKDLKGLGVSKKQQKHSMQIGSNGANRIDPNNIISRNAKTVFILPPIGSGIGVTGAGMFLGSNAHSYSNTSRNINNSPSSSSSGDGNSPLSNNSPPFVHMTSPSLPAIKRVSNFFHTLSTNNNNNVMNANNKSSEYPSLAQLQNNQCTPATNNNNNNNNSLLFPSGPHSFQQHHSQYVYQEMASNNHIQQGFALPNINSIGASNYLSTPHLPQPGTHANYNNTSSSSVSVSPHSGSTLNNTVVGNSNNTNGFQNHQEYPFQNQKPMYTDFHSLPHLPLPSSSSSSSSSTSSSAAAAPSGTRSSNGLPNGVTMMGNPLPHVPAFKNSPHVNQNNLFGNSALAGLNTGVSIHNASSTYGIFQKSTQPSSPDLSSLATLSLEESDEDNENSDTNEDEISNVLEYMLQEFGLVSTSGNCVEMEGHVFELNAETIQAVCDYLDCVGDELDYTLPSTTKTTASKSGVYPSDTKNPSFVQVDYPTIVF